MTEKDSRRSFVKSAGLTAGLILAAPAVHAKTKYRWKMVTTWPKNFPALGTGANKLAQMIEQMSDGRLKIKVYGGGELVAPLGVFDSVSQGAAEMGHGAAYYWKGKHEASQFFAAVPFGLNAQEMNAWIHYGGGQKLWDELYGGFGLKAFAVGNTGVQMGGWFKKKINSAEDFKGLKIRMPGLGGEVLTKLGATVVTLAGGEIFQSLQTGAIDATEWVGPYNDLAFGLFKAAKYYYTPGWHEPGTTIECMINKKAYEALPADLKHIVAYACKAANEDMLAEFMARSNLALDTLIKKHGVQLLKFPDDLMKKIGEASKEVVAATASKDPLTKKVYQSFNDFRQKSIRWNQNSEELYSQIRSSIFN